MDDQLPLLPPADLRRLVQLWTQLDLARDMLAQTRSSIYLSADAVEQATRQVIDLRDSVMAIMRGDAPIPDPRERTLGPL